MTAADRELLLVIGETVAELASGRRASDRHARLLAALAAVKRENDPPPVPEPTMKW